MPTSNEVVRTLGKIIDSNDVVVGKAMRSVKLVASKGFSASSEYEREAKGVLDKVIPTKDKEALDRLSKIIPGCDLYNHYLNIEEQDAAELKAHSDSKYNLCKSEAVLARREAQTESLNFKLDKIKSYLSDVYDFNSKSKRKLDKSGVDYFTGNLVVSFLVKRVFDRNYAEGRRIINNFEGGAAGILKAQREALKVDDKIEELESNISEERTKIADEKAIIKRIDKLDIKNKNENGVLDDVKQGVIGALRDDDVFTAFEKEYAGDVSEQLIIKRKKMKTYSKMQVSLEGKIKHLHDFNNSLEATVVNVVVDDCDSYEVDLDEFTSRFTKMREDLKSSSETFQAEAFRISRDVPTQKIEFNDASSEFYTNAEPAHLVLIYINRQVIKNLSEDSFEIYAKDIGTLRISFEDVPPFLEKPQDGVIETDSPEDQDASVDHDNFDFNC